MLLELLGYTRVSVVSSRFFLFCEMLRCLAILCHLSPLCMAPPVSGLAGSAKAFYFISWEDAATGHAPKVLHLYIL